MNLQRIQYLENIRKEEPDDPFTVYALALEYRSGKPEKSRQLFEELLRDHPEYLGTYYQAAALYTELGLTEEAEKIYIKGIEVAKNQNDQHALKELNTAYLNFRFDE